MSTGTVLAVAVTLAAGSAWAADKAQPRDGGSADSARSVGESHHSGSHHVSSPSDDGNSSWSKTGNDASGAPGAYSESADRGRSRPPQTAAQRRHPRPGTGTGRFDDNGRGGNRYVWGGGNRYAWGSSYYGYGRYGYYYNPYDSWYSPYYYSGYYGYSPSYYRRSRGHYRDSGSLRILVDPEKTRVYVDGYYAGVADDFDGIFQRLNVPPGRHDITLKLEGYRTQHFKVYVPVDDTIKIHYDMVRGGGEATSEEFAGRPADDYARIEDMDDEDGRLRDGDGRSDGRDQGRYEGRDQGDTGSVRLQVNPTDASVYVDGEFRGSGRQSSNLRLRPGRHRIEVVRPGYRTVEREVEVRSGQSTELEFDLERL